MSTAGSIPDSQLGLTQAEMMILRQTQEVAAQGRGRESPRPSQPSSRAPSAASSAHSIGRITMDSTSLIRIENALNNMARGIQARIEQVSHLGQPRRGDRGTNLVFAARRGGRSVCAAPISWSRQHYPRSGPRNREVQKDLGQT